MYKAVVRVSLKKKILDPQGKAIEHSLHNLGYTALGSVRTGKTIEISIDENDKAAALSSLHAACSKLLSNPVTEDYEFDLFAEDGKGVSHFSSTAPAGKGEKLTA